MKPIHALAVISVSCVALAGCLSFQNGPREIRMYLAGEGDYEGMAGWAKRAHEAICNLEQQSEPDNQKRICPTGEGEGKLPPPPPGDWP